MSATIQEISATNIQLFDLMKQIEAVHEVILTRNDCRIAWLIPEITAQSQVPQRTLLEQFQRSTSSKATPGATATRSVTARTAGKWVGVYRNSAALYYPKLRQKWGFLSVMSAILTALVRANVGVNGVATFTPCPWRMRPAKPPNLFGGLYRPFAAPRYNVLDISGLSIIVSIIPKHLWEIIATLSME